ncbi:MAG: ABC transporter ATP-binding protein [Bacteriovoracaceae bacterium]|nr:ABC transporter ATP-binding protein [Bacteriovoracaceae bacterium]
MNSTSSSDVILKVENLNMTYSVSQYGSGSSLRDFFIDALRSPYRFVFKKKDELKILSDISFEFRKGDRIGIIGVNGVGKTTLCRCITEMITPTSGTVTINGDVRSIFNSAIGINGELTGRENAHLLAKLLFQKLTKSELMSVVSEAIEFSEINEFIDVPIKHYSKGMRTRLSLSVISSLPTDLLILDEVLDGADQFFREKISRRMFDIINRSGVVVLVSHGAEEIEQICNRVLLLNDGKILFDGNVKKGLAVYKHLGRKYEQ